MLWLGRRKKQTKTAPRERGRGRGGERKARAMRKLITEAKGMTSRSMMETKRDLS